jgi:hypothetical protein
MDAISDIVPYCREARQISNHRPSLLAQNAALKKKKTALWTTVNQMDAEAWLG